MPHLPRGRSSHIGYMDKSPAKQAHRPRNGRGRGTVGGEQFMTWDAVALTEQFEEEMASDA